MAIKARKYSIKININTLDIKKYVKKRMLKTFILSSAITGK